jgi:hypothetical protein
VIGTVRHSETLEPLTLYRALYGEQGLWVRPAAMFNEEVVIDGVRQPRFARVDSFMSPRNSASDRARVDEVFLGQHALTQASAAVSPGSTGTTACARIGPWSSSGCDPVHRGAGHLAARIDGALVGVQARQRPAAATDGC